MKNILAIILLTITSTIYAQSDLPIYNDVQFSAAFDWDETSDNEIIVPSPFAKPELRIPKLIDFEKFEVSKITYYYSQNKSNPTFSQNSLSDKRYQKLMLAYPKLNHENIIWTTKIQNICDNNECAEELFHGFVLELKPIVKQVQEIQKVFGHDQLEDQSFNIKGEHENVLIGKDGTKILVPANAFVDSRGRVVQGNLTIKLKEALNLKDIVFGNLNTITTSGEALMSKGMVKIEAFKGRYALELAQGKALTVEVPTKFEEGYSYYKGDTKTGELAWNQPEIIVKGAQLNMNESNRAKWGFKLVNMPYVEKVGDGDGLDSVLVHLWNQKIYFSKAEYDVAEAIKLGVIAKVARKIENWFSKDEFDFDDIANKIYGAAWEKQSWLPWFWIPVRWNGMINEYSRENKEVGNVLAMNKLGWANIDCLARLKNLTSARFNVDVDSPSNVKDFTIALIVPSVNSMIPGFKRRNGNYSFTHGENEDKVCMPKNEKVFVMVRGTKDNQQYFAIQEYKLGAQAVVNIEMKQVDQEEMIEELKSTL